MKHVDLISLLVFPNQGFSSQSSGGENVQSEASNKEDDFKQVLHLDLLTSSQLRWSPVLE